MGLGRRVTATIQVEWELDPVPGWNYEPSDMIDHIRYVLKNGVGHYEPTITVLELDGIKRNN